MIKKSKENLISLFNESFLINLNAKMIIFLIYSIIFFLADNLFKYIVPLVVAFILAICVYPLKKNIITVTNYIQKEKFKMKKIKNFNGVISMFITISIVILFSFIIGGIILKITVQLTEMFYYISDVENLNIFFEKFSIFIMNINNSAKEINPSILNIIEKILINIAESSTNYMSEVFKKFIITGASLPILLPITILTLIAMFFFIKDMEKIKSKLLSTLSGNGLKYISNIKKSTNKLLVGYIKTYLIIMTITFIEVLIVYKILGIKYALPLALLSAVLDFLPGIGLGLIYFIIGVVYLVLGNKLVSIGLIIAYLIAVCVRTMLEQKLVADNLGLHPIIVIITLLLLITPAGIKGALYFLSLCITLKIADEIKTF